MSFPAQMSVSSQQELAQLQAQISALEDKKISLAREAYKVHISIRELQVRVARITNQSAPISRLPSDVLAIIFEELRHLPPSPIRYQPALVEIQLSHVSCRWREVALNTPSLWSSIRYPILHRDRSLTAYLDRCGECLLDVHIGPRSTSQASFQTVISTLLPRINRFRELTIDALGREELCALLSLFHNATAPAMKRLKLNCQDAVNMRDLSPIKIFQGGTPLLSDIRLDGIPLVLPSSGVTTLHLTAHLGSAAALSQTAFFDLMSCFSSLSCLHLMGFILGNNRADDFPAAPFELPSLRELLIHGNAVSTGFSFFETVSTPNIEVLSLENLRQNSLSFIHKFIASCPENFQRLRALQYLHCEFGDDLDIYLPHATPALTELSVSADVRLPLLRLLLNSDKQAVLLGTPALWSNLRVIKLQARKPWDGGNDSDSDDLGNGNGAISLISTLLFNIVSHRRRLGNPLAFVHFEGPFCTSLCHAFEELFRKEEQQSVTKVRKTWASDNSPDWSQMADYYGYFYRRAFFEKLQTGRIGQ
ncbi:hypothetical protein BJ138DRAFT_1070830 [Hygrophoropsis aurantiaca]|uniref:Uncharacterized protein n=1 Tax=Hygrophoropsis aurantiaca TaxID=72124 RepID=A0ACB8A0G7_9AGAM|nr:hypothetical protein BJ138DRAFT_1070830 [Hygrophoropsis aurantiaca]